MTQTKILTISVAAYNVEAVLRKCLDSFLGMQRLDDIEVIITDDGSKDSTAAIAAEYVSKYPASFKLISKENGGHGSTINSALATACGKYFKIVDGDDWVDAAAMDALVDFLINSDADLVINNYVEVYPDRQERINCCAGREINRVYSFKEALTDGNSLVNREVRMHSCTVKLAAYQLLGLKISEKRFYVDTEYVFFLLMATRTVVFREEYVYQYRLGSEGQSVSPTGIYKHIEDLIFVVKRLLCVYTEKEQRLSEPGVRSYLFGYLELKYRLIFSWFSQLRSSDKDYLLSEFCTATSRNYSAYVKKFDLGVYTLVPYWVSGSMVGLRLLRRILGR